MVDLRASQQKILAYQGGKMGIMAVPGSGKTWTLSLLAAEIITRNWLKPGQEVLVVTLVNSAVDNFYQRMRQFLKMHNLMPLDFRVRTLHGLAHDIVRERPELVELSEDFQIIDERETGRILTEAVHSWLRGHPNALDDYLNLEMDEAIRESKKRNELPKMVNTLANNFIRYAKDLQLSPARLGQMLDDLPMPLPLAQLGCDVYSDYQRALLYRGGVDFDDLISKALQVLERDPQLLARLGERWPYILEDEAQDSSRLQEQILGMLASQHGNWVRVGDPNQAIYETFTTANPEFLRQFVTQPEVLRRELPESGRSTASIIWLANRLVDWTQQDHPVAEVGDALQAPPYIQPTTIDDPQPNPPDNPTAVVLLTKPYSAEGEIKAVVENIAKWLESNEDSTVAVLAPRNERGRQVVEALNQAKIPVHDGLLNSSRTTRQLAQVLSLVLQHLANPSDAARLSDLFSALYKRKQFDTMEEATLKHQAELVHKCANVEHYLWPGPDQDWLEELARSGEPPEMMVRLEEFRAQVRKWQAARSLPIDQLVLTIGQDIFFEPAELALNHKLAVVLAQAAGIHPDWRLNDLNKELLVIANNERRFLGFTEDDSGFDPDAYKGKVLVATVHKAKGLEWDRVYLMSLNNYDFPGGMAGDIYYPEKDFIRDKLNLEAEALAQLKTLQTLDEYNWYQEGKASQQARLDYVRERLRLFYVGITRARKELVITCNRGRYNNLTPALALVALQALWEEHLNELC